jgi:3-oxoacyl-[acyl-carrier protein] reductase
MARVVVVSGGGTGIGRAIAQRFAEAGETVVLLGRRKNILERAAVEIGRASGADIEAVAADVREPHEVESVSRRIVERHGQVDVLVNNAGANVALNGPTDSLAALARAWSENFRTNVLTAVLVTQALTEALRSPGGRVLMMSSIAAERGAGAYGASKAALHPYAYELAAALGPRGITVNVIAPGYIEGTEFFGSRLTDARRERLIAETYVQRPGSVEDVAATAYWLAGPEASHVTAQIVRVNGGAAQGH